MVPPHRAPFRGRLRGRANGTRTAGGVSQEQPGGCPIPPFHFSLSLFGFFVLDRPTRTTLAERGETGATPLFSPLARLFVGGGGVYHVVYHAVSHPSPLAKRGRSRPKSSLQEGSDARQRARADTPTSGAMTRRVVGFLLTVGGMSSWCGWHWPAVFPVDGPMAVLMHCHTPNLYRAVVAWYCVAPAAGVSIAGQVMIAASRIWFARRGGGLPLPAPTAFA